MGCERSTTGQVKEFPGQLQHALSVIVERKFYLFLILYIFYHIRFVRYTSVTRTLFGCSLSVTCSVCAPYDFRVDIHCH